MTNGLKATWLEKNKGVEMTFMGVRAVLNRA
jgi:hypothetical protein